ncbi:MAG: protoporphyrinogen oxidase, partial [Pirellulales bacterium]
TRLLSLRGKLRLAAERLVPPRPAYDPVTEPHLEESLAQFATRRLGREAFAHLVQPLVSGIYSADPEQLSVAATLPRFLDMERRYGSLTAAMRAKARASEAGSPGAATDSGARYSLFMAPRLGMSQLTEAAASRLPPGALRLGSRLLSVDKQEDGWRLVVDGQPDSILADGLILAAPAGVSARLLRPTDAALAGAIDSIPLGGCSVVCLGFRRAALKQPPEGFGFVVPAVENSPILAASYSSEKFSGRADDEHFLVRVFVGGAGKEHLAALSDDELAALAVEGMRVWLGMEEPPVLRRVARWHGAMPQYHLGHLALVQRIEDLVAHHASLAVAGNAYRGVGIPQCIQSGEAAAEQVLGAASRIP